MDIFFKYNSAGNDFIIIDNRDNSFLANTEYIKKDEILDIYHNRAKSNDDNYQQFGLNNNTNTNTNTSTITSTGTNTNTNTNTNTSTSTNTNNNTSNSTISSTSNNTSTSTNTNNNTKLIIIKQQTYYAYY